MISNRTAAILFLITLNMQLVAASSPDGPQEPSPSDKPTLKKRQGPTPKPGGMLVDTTNDVSPVEVQKGSTEVINTSQELSVSHDDNQFKELIVKGEYEKIFENGKDMSDEEFLRRLCPVIETLDQYKEIVKYLKDRNLVASFYVYGNIGVVKRAIAESTDYSGYNDYVNDGDLETALPLALNEDRPDRVVGLLDIRKGITAKKDELIKFGIWKTSFGWFVYSFLYHLAPWERDDTAFKRFLILHVDELRSKHREILDTLCEELSIHLHGKLDEPKAERLLIDLIGQPSLLTPVAFARGFLHPIACDDEDRSNFIKYGWREIIKACLKAEHLVGDKELWLVMQKENPGQFPSTEEALAAILKHIPTKQQKEDEWIRKNVPGFLETVEPILPDIFPVVLIPIVIEYASPTWIDVPSTKL